MKGTILQISISNVSAAAKRNEKTEPGQGRAGQGKGSSFVRCGPPSGATLLADKVHGVPDKSFPR